MRGSKRGVAGGAWSMLGEGGSGSSGSDSPLDLIHKIQNGPLHQNGWRRSKESHRQLSSLLGGK